MADYNFNLVNSGFSTPSAPANFLFYFGGVAPY